MRLELSMLLVLGLLLVGTTAAASSRSTAAGYDPLGKAGGTKGARYVKYQKTSSNSNYEAFKVGDAFQATVCMCPWHCKWVQCATVRANTHPAIAAQGFPPAFSPEAYQDTVLCGAVLCCPDPNEAELHTDQGNQRGHPAHDAGRQRL